MQNFVFEGGDRMPMFGLGTWKSRPGEVRAAVRTALDAGYRHVDCAWTYGNEAEVGEGLADAFGNGLTREDVWITSKLWNSFHAPEDVRPALKETLAHLGLDYLDLYLMHWPVALRRGVGLPKDAQEMVPPDELPFTTTWTAMEDCVDAGLVRHIGVSNFSVKKLDRLLDVARVKPAMNQVELHPYLQQAELVAFCAEHGIHVTAYSPLGSSDRPQGMHPQDEPVLLEDPALRTIATAHGVSVAQILIAWALARGTAVIPKSVHAERIRENLAATRITLTDADLAAIAKLDRHRRYLTGSFWALPGSGYTMENLWDE